MPRWEGKGFKTRGGRVARPILKRASKSKRPELVNPTGNDSKACIVVARNDYEAFVWKDGTSQPDEEEMLRLLRNGGIPSESSERRAHRHPRFTVTPPISPIGIPIILFSLWEYMFRDVGKRSFVERSVGL